jgi:hypothetical protein
LIRVQVTPEFATRLRGEAVDQRVGQLFHGRPQAVAAARAPAYTESPRTCSTTSFRTSCLERSEMGDPDDGPA